MKRNWRRGIIGGLSFSSALFIFQACYGMPQDFEPDLLISGQVSSKTSGLPIKGVKVSVEDFNQYSLTDEEGNFSFYTTWMDSLIIQFADIDSTKNGSFADKDTLVSNIKESVTLDVEMEEK